MTFEEWWNQNERERKAERLGSVSKKATAGDAWDFQQEIINRLHEEKQPKGLIASTKIYYEIRRTAETLSQNQTRLITGRASTFFGLEILRCNAMPDSEMLSFTDRQRAIEFIRMAEIEGYEEAKRVFIKEEG